MNVTVLPATISSLCMSLISALTVSVVLTEQSEVLLRKTLKSHRSIPSMLPPSASDMMVTLRRRGCSPSTSSRSCGRLASSLSLSVMLASMTPKQSTDEQTVKFSKVKSGYGLSPLNTVAQRYVRLWQSCDSRFSEADASITTSGVPASISWSRNSSEMKYYAILCFFSN